MMSYGSTSITNAWSQFRLLDQGETADRYVSLVRALLQQTGTHNPGRIYLAHELTRLHSGLDEHSSLALFALALCGFEAIQLGSTRFPIDVREHPNLATSFSEVLPEGLWDSLNLNPNHLAQIALKAIENNDFEQVLCHDNEAERPFTLRNGWMHETRILRQEERLATEIRRLDQARPNIGFEQLPEMSLDFPLTDEQSAAVSHALRHSLTLVTGGPGTGKTSIVVGIIQGFLHHGLSVDAICLGAPTGKAAWRMDQAIRDGLASASHSTVSRLSPATTLHRVLGYIPGTGKFRRHHRDPIAQEVIIIDEASMIDTVLMERLLNAAKPGCHLILLGDSDQLPSVAAGCVYQDLISAFPDSTIRLTQSFRMRADDPAGSRILEFANSIRRSEGVSISMDVREDVQALMWQGVEHLDPQNDLISLCEHWYDRVHWDLSVETLARFDHVSRWDLSVPDDGQVFDELLGRFEAAQALSVTRAGPTGVGPLNAIFHEIHNRRHGFGSRAAFLPGEPVVMRKNDYSRGLFNGDQGVVIGPRQGPTEQYFVVFRGAELPRVYPLAGLVGQLDLAYTLTVHQSQGSEYESVLLLLPEQDGPLLTRELLYTAVTRSRKSVVIVGHEQLLLAATARSADRWSTLPELLSGHGVLEEAGPVNS